MLAEDRKSIIEKIKIATSTSQSVVDHKYKDGAIMFNAGLQAVSNASNNPVEFLIDVMVVTLGNEKVEQAVNKVIGKLFKPNTKLASTGKNLDDSIKDFILKGLKTQNEGMVLPEYFIDQGYTVPVRIIHLFDLYKIDPSSVLGSILYSEDRNSFDRAFQTYVLMAGFGTPVMLDNLQAVRWGYSPTSNYVTMLGNVPKETTVNAFFDQIFADPNFKLIDKKKILLDCIDAIFNNLNRNKTKNSIQNEEVIKGFVDNIVNKTESDTTYDFNPKVLKAIDNAIEKRKSGVFTMDLGCNADKIELSEEDVMIMLENPSFTTSLYQVLYDKGGVAPDDSEAVKENVNRGLLKALLFVLLKNTLFSPRIWSLIILSVIFKTGWEETIYYKMFVDGTYNNYVQDANTIFEVLKSKEKMIDFIVDALMDAFITFLLDIVIKEIMKLIAPMVLELQKEKVTQYKDLMLSLATMGMGK